MISFSDIPPENAVPCIKENNLHQNFSSNGKPPIDLGLSAGQGFCVVFLCKTLYDYCILSLSLSLGKCINWYCKLKPGNNTKLSNELSGQTLKMWMATISTELIMTKLL